MDKEEIKDYLKRADELGVKLTGEDKETYAWLIYGYNHCAKLLNETEQQCKKQKEVIDRAEKILNECKLLMPHEFDWEEQVDNALDILKEVSE